jgi:hypothetical protein
MITNFQTVQDTLIALSAVIGLAVLVAVAIVAAAGLVRRDQARHTRTAVTVPATATIAQQPTQTDDARQLVLR